MTAEERIAAIRERLMRATSGPWCAEHCGDKCTCIVIGTAFRLDDRDAELPLEGWQDFYDENGNDVALRDEAVCVIEDDCSNPSDNADFIMHSRADIEWLLARGVGDVRAWIAGLTDEQLDPFVEKANPDIEGTQRKYLPLVPIETLRAELRAVFRADLLALCGGSEQTQAPLEPRQHQGVNTVAPDCEVISALPATHYVQIRELTDSELDAAYDDALADYALAIKYPHNAATIPGIERRLEGCRAEYQKRGKRPATPVKPQDRTPRVEPLTSRTDEFLHPKVKVADDADVKRILDDQMTRMDGVFRKMDAPRPPEEGPCKPQP